jgi:two-component system nitrate/nitrite sensor histidine kinase NarX
MKIGKQFLTQSLLVRLGIAMGTIAVLALASIVSSAVFTETSEGKAGAINIAGSLRMQSYLIASQTADPHLSRAEKRERVERGLANFESRLNNPVLTGSLPGDERAALQRTYREVSTMWRERIRPAAEAALADGAREAAFLAMVPGFVGRVDHLVTLFEEDLESRIRTLRLYQGIALFLIVFVIFAAMYLMHTQVLVPLSDLLAASRAVRRGDFRVRAAHTGADELGQLGHAFNYMVEDLSAMYANLEARVAEKTEELGRTNRSLELLYNTTRTLSERALTNETLAEVLRDVERVIGVPAGVICAHEGGQTLGFPLASTALGPDGRPELCANTRCEECFAEGALREQVAADGSTVVSIPLAESGRSYGVMPLAMRPGRRLEPWQLKLAEAVGHHIGAALATARRAEERHRIALFEERSVIARELHDSLAQSLSYLKIQVVRLQALLDRDAPRHETGNVVDELRTGLNNAYRQLRELLTTFRLRIDGRGLTAALEDTVREFTRRTGLDIRLVNRVLGAELASNEEIHVLQVIREALSNVEHHARARRVDIVLEHNGSGGVRVRVEDDGVGIRDARAPTHHYGMAIMRDRAASLNGELTVRERDEGGTRVELEFVPSTPYRDTAAAAA